MTRSKIVVLTTGGTIASQLDASGRNRSGALKGETLLAQVSLPSDFTAQVEVRSLLQNYPARRQASSADRLSAGSS